MGKGLLFSLAACWVVACLGCRGATSEEEEDAVLTEPVVVQAVRAERTTLRPSVDLVGTVVAIPEHTAVVCSQTSGWIQSVPAVDGAAVEAGDELVLLDRRVAEVELAKATAAVAEKEARLARLRRGYLPQELEMARDDVLRATQQAESLRAEFAALAPLREREEISDLQYHKADSALRAAEASKAAAEAKLKLVEAGTPVEEIRQAEAQLATANAELAGAKLTLQFCRITSPIAGTVTQLVARQGMFVDRAAPLLTVADLGRLFVTVRVPAAHAGQVTVGARVDVFPSEHAERPLPGAIARIAGKADATTGDLVASVEIPNTQMLLRPGMSCRARLWLPESPGTLAVPAVAVADRSGTPVVTVARDGQAHEIEVVTGIRTDELVEIRQGLSAGDWVVTQGGYGLPDGCPVRIAGPSSREDKQQERESQPPRS